MRQKRDVCPECKAAIEPNYRYCLACGQELPEREADASAPPPAAPTQRSDMVTCQHCNSRLVDPGSACPACGAELDTPRGKRDKDKKRSSAPAKRLSLRTVLIVLVFGSALVGVGALMLAPGAESTRSSLSFASLSDFQIPHIFGDDQVMGDNALTDDAPGMPDEAVPDRPADVAADSVGARVVGVADDGLIRIRIDGAEINVALAGISPSFINQCLGEKALARVRRILVDESIVFVALDGNGTIDSSGEAAIQSVYIWHYNTETMKVRFVNEELLGGGEAAFKRVKLDESEQGLDLAEAAERAETKGRGRYEPGACD